MNINHTTLVSESQTLFLSPNQYYQGTEENQKHQFQPEQINKFLAPAMLEGRETTPHKQGL